MYSAIVKKIEDKIKDLPFIQNYGGLVQNVTVWGKDKFGLDTPKTFPISCNATIDQCLGSNMYTPIVPNDSYFSLAYFEVKDKLKLSGVSGAKAGNPKYKGVLRLVVWLNLQKLGYSSCDDVCGFIRLAIQSGIVDCCNVNDGCLNGSTVEIGYPAICENDPTIFQKYSYNKDIIKTLLYPYTYFALDFPVKLDLGCKDKLVYEPQEPIKCQVV